MLYPYPVRDLRIFRTMNLTKFFYSVSAMSSKSPQFNGDYYCQLAEAVLKGYQRPNRPQKLTKTYQICVPWFQQQLCMTLNWLTTFRILLFGPPMTIPDMKKTHLAGNQYYSNDNAISAVVSSFDKQDEIFFTNGIQTLQHRQNWVD